MPTMSSTQALSLRHPDKLFIGGQWVAPYLDTRFEIRNSHSEEVAFTVPEAGKADVARAVAAAREAFDAGPWPRFSHVERAKYLRAIADAFERRSDEFARAWSLETGILFRISQARIGAILAGPFRQYAAIADSFAFEERHKSASGLEALLVREPVGVVAAIVPWNGPGGLMAQKCAPALIAGCTLVVKPSPEAPGEAYLFAEICEEVGLPAGVVNVLTTDREASQSLVDDPGIDKVTFTGSTEAGRAIAAACGKRIARVTLELGGKSPAIILDDYDIEAAASTIAAGCTFLTGQVCHSLTRVIVQRDRHDEMVEALAAQVNALTVGDPFDPASDIGPLATDRQRDAVLAFVEGAKADGATLAAGGRRPAHLQHGYYVEPTVFGNVDNSSALGQREVFGPVLSVIPADDEAHAFQLANDTIFGLNSSVFTNDPDRFRAAARRLRAGTVGHNASRTDSTISFGGFKQSGLGREGGVDGLMPFLESKLVVLDQPYAG